MNKRVPWWRDATGYEIYVRSFLDSDGDGVGDLAGVRAGLDHVAELGVDVVWLAPFYPSPQADHGYDVADYRAVDPTFGTLEGLDRLVEEAHERGLKVLIDLVPNHTSDQHPWFRSALDGPDAARRDYYVWRDPAPDGGPPNNWRSHFGGPAWTLDPDSGQYYLHLFLPEQPDLNWANPAVRDEFDAILDWWLERGVDGVRIDVAHGLVIDPQLADNPVEDAEAAGSSDPREAFAAYAHDHDLDQPGVVEIYRRWRRIADRHDAVLLGEVYVLDPDRVRRYVGADLLHLAFCFTPVHVDWDPGRVREALRAAVAAGGSRFAWPLSSHDAPRAATRFGGGGRGRRRALAYLTLLCALPGVVFLLQGDELALEDGDIDPAAAADPLAVRNPGAVGRDGARTPMPWEPGPNLGFTTGTPWLPVGRNHGERDTVAVQAQRPGSPLRRVRRLLGVRRRLVAGRGTKLRWVGSGPLVALDRDGLVAACNLGHEPAELAVGRAELVFASHGDADTGLDDGGSVTIPPDTAVLVDRGA